MDITLSFSSENYLINKRSLTADSTGLLLDGIRIVSADQTGNLISSGNLSSYLSNYPTNSSLSGTLSGYISTGNLNSTLSGYATTGSLSSYVTNSSLTSTLSGYTTTGNLSSSLSSYIPLSQKNATSGIATLDVNKQLVQSVPWANVSGAPSFTGGGGSGASLNTIYSVSPTVFTTSPINLKTTGAYLCDLTKIFTGNLIPSNYLYCVDSIDCILLNSGYMTSYPVASYGISGNSDITLSSFRIEQVLQFATGTGAFLNIGTRHVFDIPLNGVNNCAIGVKVTNSGAISPTGSLSGIFLFAGDLIKFN